MRPATATATHSLRRIQLVAQGLTAVLGPQDAASELRRLYGDRRATNALAAMTTRVSVHRVERTRAMAGALPRGARATDWL